ncbi:glucose-6-phosphate dehydrogenase-like protein [Cricetibacter osteomyelitidis]|uniref:Glucose-6-phosphate dehydrogenase-like protein n=1 Tax=Cricetibacter osteomyelitidis TaxID=1521931 RepID=A0A4R2SX70_9PAST|nr:HI_0552 family protein [Cricetibacter osteomyelitidis]TCP95087.1 glucose-6-phosphate dehydrogenase-like protein [Cricetibacter osteomyelitidis]
MLTAKSCELFDIPFFQFSQLKKYQPETILQIKADYKQAWNEWKALILQVSRNLGTPFAEPHIEKWCNGWQVRAHFFAYFKYEYHKNSAAILSVLLNRRRLQVSLDWHCYRADRSQINVDQYNQWLTDFDFAGYTNFDLWRGDDSEYDDFQTAEHFIQSDLNLRTADDFWCIGKNLEKDQLAQTDCAEFITQTIRDLLPLYEKCHQ